MGGFCSAACFLLLPETCRNVVGNGAYTTGGRINRACLAVLTPKTRTRPDGEMARLGPRLSRVPNPFRCLKIVVRRHDALLLASYSLFYAAYSCLQAALAPLVMQRYGLNALQAGLCFLAYGVATISSSYAVGELNSRMNKLGVLRTDLRAGKVIDYDYRTVAGHMGITINTVSGDSIAEFPIERARIRSVGYFVVVGIVATIAFGWAIESRVHLSVPLIMTFLCGGR